MERKAYDCDICNSSDMQEGNYIIVLTDDDEIQSDPVDGHCCISKIDNHFCCECSNYLLMKILLDIAPKHKQFKELLKKFNLVLKKAKG